MFFKCKTERWGAAQCQSCDFTVVHVKGEKKSSKQGCITALPSCMKASKGFIYECLSSTLRAADGGC